MNFAVSWLLLSVMASQGAVDSHLRCGSLRATPGSEVHLRDAVSHRCRMVTEGFPYVVVREHDELRVLRGKAWIVHRDNKEELLTQNRLTRASRHWTTEENRLADVSKRKVSSAVRDRGAGYPDLKLVPPRLLTLRLPAALPGPTMSVDLLDIEGVSRYRTRLPRGVWIDDPRLRHAATTMRARGDRYAKLMVTDSLGNSRSYSFSLMTQEREDPLLAKLAAFDREPDRVLRLLLRAGALAAANEPELAYFEIERMPPDPRVPESLRGRWRQDLGLLPRNAPPRIDG